MSYIYVSHVTHRNVWSHACMSHVAHMSHTCMSHVAHMPHTCMSHVTHTCISRVAHTTHCNLGTRLDGWCHTHTWVLSHALTGPITHMSHTCMRHVAHTNHCNLGTLLQRVMSHTYMTYCCGTLLRALCVWHHSLSHTYVLLRALVRHITQMSHTCTSHVTHMNKSRHTQNSNGAK